MHTFTYRWGEDGIDYTRAGLALRAMALAGAWAFDRDAYAATIRMYLCGTWTNNVQEPLTSANLTSILST